MANLYYSTDTRQTFKEVTALPAGYGLDNIFYAQIDGIIYENMDIGRGLNSLAFGVFANGQDMTDRLNYALAHVKLGRVLEIFLPEGGSSIVINGTVQGLGKIIKFPDGVRFTGTGTINNACIEAPFLSHIFDTTISLTNCTTTEPYFSIKWYGAKGFNSPADDDSIPINKAISTVVRNASHARKVLFPTGQYWISSPIILENWNTTTGKYDFVTVELEGQSSSYFTTDDKCTMIKANFRDRFAIGIQIGKCCQIHGIFVKGLFYPPFANYTEFAKTTWATFGGAHGCREAVSSPYAGIVVDPFGITVPFDGGYPAMTTWYRGPGGGQQGGSTGCRISHCKVSGFIANIVYSPNRSIQNCDSMILENCAIEAAKVGVSYGQDQTKNCIVRNCISWDSLHTFITNNVHGYANGCPPMVETVSIAGMVYRLFSIDAAGRFGFSGRNIYCESLVKIGTVTGMPSSFIDCQFDWGGVLQGGGMTPDYYFSGQNVNFSNCVFRHYDNTFNRRIWMEANNAIFQNCQFDQPPIIAGANNDNSMFGRPAKFIQCKLGANGVSMLDDDVDMDYQVYARVRRGKFKHRVTQYPQTIHATVFQEYSNADYEQTVIPAQVLTPVTVSANYTATFSWANADKVFKVDDYLRGRTGMAGAPNDPTYTDFAGLITEPILGRVTAVTSTTVTVSEVPINIVPGTGDWLLHRMRVLYVDHVFTANTTNGSPLLTNVVANFFPVVNQIIRSPYGEYTVQAVNESLREITLTASSSATASDVYFGVGQPKLTYDANYLLSDAVTHAGSTAPILKGGIWNDWGESIGGKFERRSFLITKSGWIVANGTTKPVQAEWKEINLLGTGSGDLVDEFSLTGDGSRPVEAGSHIEYIYLKPTVGLPALNIGWTPGGTEIAEALDLTAGQTMPLLANTFFDSAGTLYFTGVTSGTLTIKITKKTVWES